MKNYPSDLIYSGATPEQVAEDLRPLVDFQDRGLPLKRLKDKIDQCLVPHLMNYDKSGFQSLFNAFPEAGAGTGAAVALAFNQGVTNWQVSPGGATLEELCCQALCRLFGMPAGSDATFMYCGTYANQQALYMALHHEAERAGFDLGAQGLTGFSEPGNLTILASSEAHFSLRHAVRILGLGDRSLLSIPVDKNRRMDVSLLEKTLRNLQQSKKIFCAVATAGTTSTGSVDPLMDIAEVCRKHSIWLHVDGAYGLAYSLVPEWKPLFQGMTQADSMSWDPHKQMRVPIPSSLLFVRRKEDFRRMTIHGDYFNREEDNKPNPGLKSAPTTRPLSALPLVASLRHQGMIKVVESLRSPLQAIKTLAVRLQSEEDIELGHLPDTGILCLRLRPEGIPESQLDKLQNDVYTRILDEGRRAVSITRLDGKTYLRFVAISPLVTAGALMETVTIARRYAQDFRKS